MASIGTFGSFGIARLGIYASSAALNVTGNNIANINTNGYCRQKVDLSALSSGGVDKFASSSNLSFGWGVSTDSLSQYRDPYMDIRFRDENTNTGEYNTKLDGLSDLAFVLDEVASGDADFGIIEAQFSELVEQLQILSEKAGSEEYDTLVRSTAETLTQLFNSYSQQLETVADNQLEMFLADVNDTNTLLTNIRDMNEQIRVAGVYGDPALTLRDQRNVLIDELSSKIGIDVIYSDEDLGAGLIVQKLTIRIAGTDIELVDGNYCTQISLPETINMPNTSLDDDDQFLFDTSDVSSYMYLDPDGNPTNDKELADLWYNPDYPEPSYYKLVDGVWEEGSEGDGTLFEGRWLDANGLPTKNAFAAGPAVNPAYGGENEPVETTLWVDGVETDVLVTTYYFDANGVPLATPYMEITDDTSNVIASGVTEDGDTIVSGQALLPWYGGEYAMGEWDEETGDWKKNPDGSYYIYTTTNDPYAASMNVDEDGDGEMDALVSRIQLNNYVTEGETYDNDNYYLLSLSGLQDKNGNYITNSANVPLDGSILLTDTGHSGTLLANRELLTEEGEYSSVLDIYMDDDATTKRGIPYYRFALDSLAQQFAAMFNEANNLNPQDIFAVNEKGEFYDFTQDPELDKNGYIIVGADGNPTYPLLTSYDSEGNQININIDNMYDTAYDENGVSLGGTNYELYVYENGVRDPNFKVDSDGHYLTATTDPVTGEAVYMKVAVLDAYGQPMVDANGNTVYLSSSNLTIDELARLNGESATGNLTYEDLYELDAAGNLINTAGNNMTILDENGEEVLLNLENLLSQAYEWVTKDSGETDDNGDPIPVKVLEPVEDATNLDLITTQAHEISTDGVLDRDALLSYFVNDGENFQDAAGNIITTEGGVPVTYANILQYPEALQALRTQGVLTEAGEAYFTEAPVGIEQEEYNPADMFVFKTEIVTNEFNVEEVKTYFLNSLGNKITMGDDDATVITYEMAMTDPAAFAILMDEGVLTSDYENLLKAGNLFSTSSSNNDTEGIDAGNISISRDWSIGETRIVLAKGENPGSTDNSNVLYMITMMDTDFQYDAEDVVSDAWTGKKEFFKGSFQEMLTNTVSTLAQDMQTTSILLTNSEVSNLALDNARLSVSGVDLNEEASNMMQYQKSYTAAARLMTTLDEVLEVLLNM